MEAESIGEKLSPNADDIDDNSDGPVNRNEIGSSKNISEESVQFLAEKLMDFIEKKYSLCKWDEVKQVCEAAVVIFPSIELVRKSATSVKRKHHYLTFKI